MKLLGKKTGVHYIITVSDFLTKWAEAQLVKDCSVDIVAHFIFEYILSNFGCPKILITDRGSHFLNNIIEALMEEFEVHHQKSMPYHP